MTQVQEVLGLNPGAVYRHNMKFFTLICLKRPNIIEKEAGVGPFFKKNLISELVRLLDFSKVDFYDRALSNEKIKSAFSTKHFFSSF